MNRRWAPVNARARRLYIRHLRPHLRSPLAQQRVRLLWQGWPYLRLLGPSALRPGERVRLLARCVITDWTLVHAHRPVEIAEVLRGVARRRAQGDEVVVEAGCWTGGATVKLSLVCATLGYQLWVFDSFAGVEAHEPEPGEYDYTGEYTSTPDELRANLARHGAPDVVSIVPGWFEQTLGAGRAPERIRGVLIDCDLAKGTQEVLSGVVPHLVEDAVVYTQDFHLPEVRAALADDGLWSELGHPVPSVRAVAYDLAEVGDGSWADGTRQ